MQEAKSPKHLLILMIICLVLAIPFFVFREKHTFIVFCDVGQGDGIYIRIHDIYDVIVDAGPGNAILSCLGKHMPFYDRTIDVAIMTHPQADHIEGFESILSRYNVRMFVMSRLTNTSKLFHRIEKLLVSQHVRVTYIKAGDSIAFGTDSLKFLWPTEDFQNKYIFSAGNDMRLSRRDDNDFSVISLLREGSHTVLLTGDASPSVLATFTATDIHDITIFKVPHHGSVNGLSHYFFSLANPGLSVISVGKNNKFGHPSAEIISMLKDKNKKYLRTDIYGSIKVTLLNETFTSETER